ncbi:dihydroorotate dehydrogenase electron transfer subunit [Desulfosediminicola ganghwensis]|uniref:dihydroorotate dehydrogenase electron transfer subunit n=1 Tax=Desulfosediminicola ganghwensis TaxID=2569540 RepID=UPI0010AB955D|nr:dihydroorotate dehydrogenase electron transfer subunit [Desulfosediminicola ganghwensis]
MPQYQEKTIVTRVEHLSDENVRLTLKAPQIASACKPGQFVMIRAALGKDPLLRRPFSIHQADSSGHIQVYFKIVGRGTDLLAHLKVGEEVSVLGPLGKAFTIDKDRPVCLVGGGLGIAPMLYLAKEISRSKTGSTNGDLVILGGRTKGEVEPVMADFDEIGIRTLATTDDGSYGTKGFVTELLKSSDLPANTQVYACGPEPMMGAVSLWCEEQKLACQVSVESVMACGMGACLGCSRPVGDGKYVHVCLDGPVFDARELKWNS